MNTFQKNITSRAQDIRLTKAERSRILSTLGGATPRIASPYLFFFHTRTLAVAFSFILVVGITGGTAFASEGSVPGDVLYSLKRGVVEPVAGALAISTRAKVAWHATVAETRLKEAEVLASRGTLTDENAGLLADDFALHARAVGTYEKEGEGKETGAHADVSTDVTGQAFRSVLAKRSAAVLDAALAGENEHARLASADFVVRVLGTSDGEDRAGQGARMSKGAGEPEAPQAMSVSLAATTSLNEDEAHDEPLSKLVHRAEGAVMQTLQKSLAHNDSEESRSLLLRHLVEAKAKAVLGEADAASALARVIAEAGEPYDSDEEIHEEIRADVKDQKSDDEKSEADSHEEEEHSSEDAPRGETPTEWLRSLIK